MNFTAHLDIIVELCFYLLSLDTSFVQIFQIVNSEEVITRQNDQVVVVDGAGVPNNLKYEVFINGCWSSDQITFDEWTKL